MGKIKVSEATDIQLDWLVAKCEGYSATIKPLEIVYTHPNGAWHHNGNWKPTEKSVQMWPIIDREKISIRHWDNTPVIHAYLSTPGSNWSEGQTPLIAAARCYVTSKLGEEVEIPEELM